jgi:hypothetical protein
MFKASRILIALGIIILLIVVGVGAFTYGRNAGLTEQINIRTDFIQQRTGVTSSTSASGNPSGDAAAQGARGAAVQGRQLATGVVKSVQGNVVQITLRDGSTTSFTLDDKTNITKTSGGTIADIQPGWTIVVSEQTGAGGATTQRVLLTQEVAPGQGQGQRGGQGQPTPKP